jgi:hypothetical protein
MSKGGAEEAEKASTRSISLKTLTPPDFGRRLVLLGSMAE